MAEVAREAERRRALGSGGGVSQVQSPHPHLKQRFNHGFGATGARPSQPVQEHSLGHQHQGPSHGPGVKVMDHAPSFFSLDPDRGGHDEPAEQVPAAARSSARFRA